MSNWTGLADETGSARHYPVFRIPAEEEAN